MRANTPIRPYDHGHSLPAGEYTDSPRRSWPFIASSASALSPAAVIFTHKSRVRCADASRLREVIGGPTDVGITAIHWRLTQPWQREKDYGMTMLRIVAGPLPE
jgi:hypothetical protein